jgi:hypothetical protein
MSQDPQHKKAENKSSYIGLGVAMGLSIGYMFGLLILDDGPLGAGLGLVLGITMASIADDQAAKRN